MVTVGVIRNPADGSVKHPSSEAEELLTMPE